MPDFDFVNDLRIDKAALDECAINQPELYAKWALLCVDAEDRRNRLKDRLTLVRSECDADIRANASDWGWDNPTKAPTESFIQAAIPSHEDYIKANNEYLTACREFNELQVAREAFAQRKSMIGVLVQLYASDYFSGNKDLDVNYKVAISKASVASHHEILESNERLARRKK